jgi:hypothetical protein
MNETELAHLPNEVEQLRRAYRHQRWLLLFFLTALTGITLMAVGGPGTVLAAKKNSTDKDGVLHVRGVVVEDPSGHERVGLGAPLPGPMIHGVRVSEAEPYREYLSRMPAEMSAAVT